MKKIILLLSLLMMVMVALTQSTSGKYFVFLNTNPNRPEIPENEINDIQAESVRPASTAESQESTPRRTGYRTTDSIK